MNAYNFDQRAFSSSFHEKLTEEHFHLDPSSKMRNHLAEEVLDKRMFSLMEVSGIWTFIDGHYILVI